jgi:laccase
VHGAIVIHPKRHHHPYRKPHGEIPVILGEWWNEDVENLLEQAKRTGGDFKPSEDNNINGQPGDLFPCSASGTVRVPVERCKTYLLRVINAGLTNKMLLWGSSFSRC